MKEEILLGWEALEYEPRKNSTDWYWTVGIITVALIVICILLDNILLGIIIGLGSLILTIYTKKPPRVINIHLTTRGIRHNDDIYIFDNLHSYHLDEYGVTGPKLVIKSKKLLMPYIVIRLDSVTPEEVDNVLQHHLLRADHPEPVFHKILEKLGF